MANNTQNKEGWFGIGGGLRVKIGKRNLLKSMVGIAGITALAGCTITKNGSVTTATLNTQEVLNYGESILSFAKAGIGITFVTSGLGAAGVAIANTAISALDTALTAFNTAAGGAATVTFDNTSAKTAFESIVDSVEKINSYIVATITATVSDSTVVSQAKVAANAASGLISILKALVSTFASGIAPRVGAAARGDSYVAEVKTWVESSK